MPVIFRKIREDLKNSFGICRNRGEKECISKVLWGTTEYIDENALQVNVTRLKKTLKALGLENRIETIRGRGYRWKREQ